MSVLSSTLDEDNFNFEDETGHLQDNENEVSETDKPQRSRKGKFLAEVEKGLDKNNKEQIDRLEHLRIQVLNQLMKTKSRKSRSRTDSKRKGGYYKDSEPNSSRPRTISPK